MNAALEAESTLTYRYQTIVPETMHRALKLGKRDKLQYTIRPHGTVLIARAVLPEESAAVPYQFLGFLAADIARHPERIAAIDTALLARIDALVGQVEVDLDAPLSEDDE